MPVLDNLFTFQYASIKPILAFIRDSYILRLHFNMLLLNRRIHRLLLQDLQSLHFNMLLLNLYGAIPELKAVDCLHFNMLLLNLGIGAAVAALGVVYISICFY